MAHHFCLPLQCAHADQVLRSIDENSAFYRFFEVWLGAIGDLDDDMVELLLRLCAPSLIFVLRTKGLEMTLPFERRKYFMHEMAGSPALLDLDVTVQKPEIRYLEKSSLAIKTILSYHNFEKTPSAKKLRDITAWMAGHGAAVSKVAAMCNTPGDALRLLDLGLELKSQGREYIVLGMGEHGVVTRVFGTLWGNKLLFAPIDAAQASAPGQLTLAQLERIFSALSS